MIAILEKYEHNADFHQIADFVEASHLRYALTINPTVYVSHICQFWSTTRVKTSDEETKILTTVDGRLLALLFSEAGVIHANWISCGHCITSRGHGIIRLGGSTASYQFFIDLLKHFDREDMNQLWALVKETLNIRQATSNKEKELWVELKRLYEPDVEDQLWTQTHALMHDPVEWRIYGTCGVHHVLSRDQEIFIDEFPLPEDFPTANEERFPLLRIRRWRYNRIPAESRFRTPCLIVKDKFMIKAQVHVSKSSAISNVQALPQKVTLSTRLPNNTIMSNKMLREIVSELIVRSSNTIALDSPYLLVLITGTSQSRQH
nr:hypothetical protein [Tanacetum cinerariifolium]